MADVVIVAPLVTFEGDDWKECREFVTADFGETTAGLDLGRESAMITEHFCRQHLVDNLNEAQTQTPIPTPKNWCRCFGGTMAPRNDRPTSSPPDTTTTTTDADDAISDNLIWNQVPEKYDNADSQGHGNEAELLSLEDSENGLPRDQPLSEDDEAGEAMEMSCVSIFGLGEEPIKSADEVISEIVEMMEDDLETDVVSCSITLSEATETLTMKLQSMKRSSDGLTSCLKEMPLESLHVLCEELDSAIHNYSEVLLCQLVLREELGFQKELFNQFISLLLSIQKKRRMVDIDRKKGKAVVDQPAYRYLTTVIPYDDHQRAPDVDLLQIYIKILSAIDEDNSKVPALLTDYILNEIINGE